MSFIEVKTLWQDSNSALDSFIYLSKTSPEKKELFKDYYGIDRDSLKRQDLVDKVDYGYGIFIEWMLEESNNLDSWFMT